ncbi:MAG: PQQ-binding-like beta-propeller repeat protein [Patescibacteria group bacterium]
MAKRRRKVLLMAAMAAVIAAGAALFFIVGTTATKVAQEQLGDAAPPSGSPDTALFAPLAGRTLSADDLEQVAGGFDQPHGIGFFDGTLYVSDWGDDKLYAVDPETGQKRLLADELGGAHDMVQDDEGWIVTPLFKEGRVVRINPDTGEVRELTDGLDGPNGIARARDGNFYVSNNGGGTIIKLTPAGKHRTVARDLKEPAGLVVDNDNIIRVAQFADEEASVVQIFDNGKMSMVLGGLTDAESLLYDDRKNLLVGHVVDGRGALTLFTAAGERHQVLLTDLPGPLVGPVTDGEYLYLHSAAEGQSAIYRIVIPA